MKKIYLIIVYLLMASVFAQAPQKMSYQAVIRNSSNTLLTSAPVGMKISILQGSSSGTAIYVETQTPSTNANGLASLEIGSGTVSTGSFASINWAAGPYFIKTETDPTGGTTYSITGTSELISVPYALFSANGILRVTYAQKTAISSPEAGLQIWCSDCGTSGEMQVYNGTAWVNMVGGTSSSATSRLAATPTASNITATTVSSGGNITSDGGSTITARGVCWSTSQNPTTADSKTTESGTTGSFVSSITGLTANTTYYARSYAINANGTTYGAQTSFTTSSTVPTINAATAASEITETTATSGGNTTSDGGSTITARGVCWGTSQNPTIADSKTTDSGTTGLYTSAITGLTAGTTYYVRSYATNANGTSYGAQISFTTISNLPVPVVTNYPGYSPYFQDPLHNYQAINLMGVIATSVGVTASGLCWNTSPNPTVSNSKMNGIINTFSGLELVGGQFVDLLPGTTYYARAWAQNSYGVGYGAEISFTTVALQPGVFHECGKIAYIFQTGDPGYVAGEVHGIVDSNMYIGSTTWSDYRLYTTFLNNTTTGTALGTGHNNTVGYIAGANTQYTGAGSAGSSGYAHSVNYTTCPTLYWHSPSKDELYKLYLNKAVLGDAMNPYFNGQYYWTSSEIDATKAWIFDASTGLFSQGDKGTFAINYSIHYF